MKNIQFITILLGGLGCLLTVFGYLIKYKGKINLIAGVNMKNADKIKDKKGLASLVGGNILVLGIIFCTGAIAMYLKPESKAFVEQVLLLSILAVLIILFAKAKKYVA